MRRKIFSKVLLHVLFPLLIGLLIYLFFRSNVWITKQFNVKPVSYAEISSYSLLKKWIIFSGPDLCWAYSFTSAILILNYFVKFLSYGFVFIATLIIVIASELIQLFLKPSFTFSFSDFITVIAACCVSAYLNKRL
jgi:hypothetical protein